MKLYNKQLDELFKEWKCLNIFSFFSAEYQ